MKRKTIRKIPMFCALLLCFCVVFNSGLVFEAVTPDFLDVDSIEIIGYAGNTGGSTGSHLHFEVNNINAGVGDELRRSYTYTINPIYFYMNREFAFNNGCSAAENGYGFYWYNYNK